MGGLYIYTAGNNRLSIIGSYCCSIEKTHQLHKYNREGAIGLSKIHLSVVSSFIPSFYLQVKKSFLQNEGG